MKNIWYFLIVIITLGFGCANEQPDLPQELPGELLVISFDGFQYDYLERTETSHFDSLISEGVKARGLKPVIPTKTFPNHYSIVTGLYPGHHGIVANTFYDPKWEEWYRISDREAVSDGRWYGGEPIWNTAEKQGLKAGTMFWVGSEANIQGMRPSYWKDYDGSMPDKARIDTVVKWFSYEGEKSIDLGTLYFELVDEAGHDYGLHSDSLTAAIARADALMGYLKRRLRETGLLEKLNLMIVSDHGMMQLSSDRVIMLDELIDMNDVERITWGAVTMIQPVSRKTDELFDRLKAAENHYKVYRKQDLPERYHLYGHRRIPEIVMVADLGYSIMDEDYRTRFIKQLPAADHGYDNRYREMSGFFAARGPAFARGDTIPGFQSIHLYELMNHIIGTDPAPNDGSFDSVRVMLRKK